MSKPLQIPMRRVFIAVAWFAMSAAAFKWAMAAGRETEGLLLLIVVVVTFGAAVGSLFSGINQIRAALVAGFVGGFILMLLFGIL